MADIEVTLDFLNPDGSLFATLDRVRLMVMASDFAYNRDALELGPWEEARPFPLQVRARLGDLVIGSGPVRYQVTERTLLPGWQFVVSPGALSIETKDLGNG